MSHDKQDKRYAESRSRLGSMSFNEIKRHIGVDFNPDEGEDESGTPSDMSDNEVKSSGNSN